MSREAADKYDELAHEYDERWAGYIDHSINETITRIEARGGLKILDVACGTGKLLKLIRGRIADARLAGIDLSASMLRRASQRLAGTESALVQGASSALPFRSGTFDLIISTNAFHYFPDARVIQEFRRVVRDDGRIVITDWCHDYLSCKVCDFALGLMSPAHRKALGRKELREMLENNGFDVLGIDRYRVSLIWGLMTGSARPARLDS